MFPRPPRSTLFPYTTLLPISTARPCGPAGGARGGDRGGPPRARRGRPRARRCRRGVLDRKSTRLNSSHVAISYAVFCLKKKSCAEITVCCCLVTNILTHVYTD